MADHVRWGILGAAQFAREQMAIALHAAPRGALTAIATRDPAKAAPFAALAPGLRVHHGYDALLEDPDVDAVYIPLPNSMHVPWALKCLEAGKHVLVEKPVGMTLDEIDALIAARDRTGLVAAEAYMILHHPQWARVRELLAENAVGTLRHIDGTFTFDLQDLSNIRQQKETGGGGLRDIGIYPFGSARFATGEEPVDVAARIEWQRGIDVHAQVWARFGAATFSAFVSMQAERRQEMVFHGSAGYLVVEAPFNPGVIGEARLVVSGRGHGERVERWPSVRQYDLQVAAFNAAVLDGAPFPVTLEFSRGSQAMIEAALAAGR